MEMIFPEVEKWDSRVNKKKKKKKTEKQIKIGIFFSQFKDRQREILFNLIKYPFYLGLEAPDIFCFQEYSMCSNS